MPSTSKRTRVFISYSHKDAAYLTRLHAHLAYYERQKLVDFWDDTKLTAGDRWEQEILDAINQARVCIVLVSADYLASTYVADNELPQMLARARNDGALIFSVILSPSAFKHTELHQFQAINDAARPLSRLRKHDREEIWNRLAERVADAIGEPQSGVAAPTSTLAQPNGHNPSPPSARPERTQLTEIALSSGSSLIRQQHYQAAAETLAGPITYTPENFRAWFLYGVALLKLQRYSEADAALQHAFDLDYRQSAAVTKILVVDDDENTRSLLSIILEDKLPGVVVEQAANGREALLSVARSEPSLLMLDYMMPKMDGLSALRELVARGAKYPVIFMSGHPLTTEHIVEATGIPREQVTFLAKPFKFDQLVYLVEQTVARNTRGNATVPGTDLP